MSNLDITLPVLAQVGRDPPLHANLARALRCFDIHALDESISIGRRLADADPADVVDAHLRRYRRSSSARSSSPPIPTT